MDPKELYPNYDKDNNDPYHETGSSIQEQPAEDYGYHKPGAAITSMVLGICSVSMWFYPFLTSIPCIIMGWIAVKLAKREAQRSDPKYMGFVKAGRVTGMIGLIISIAYTLIMALVIGTAINGR
ncbi:MAG: DUF4190 domain-containing protein [Clostridiales bacterium]|nr:DUF4190 domain-containing protein [Clostridiales bacterium]